MSTTIRPDKATTIQTLLDWTFLTNGNDQVHTFLDFVLGAGGQAPVDAATFMIDYIEGGSSPNDGLRVRSFRSAEFAGNAPSSAWADDQIGYDENPRNSFVVATGGLSTTLSGSASASSPDLPVTSESGAAVGDQIAVITNTGASDVDLYTVDSVATGTVTVDRNADSAYAGGTAVRKVHHASFDVADKAIATLRVLLENLDSQGTDARVRIRASILKGSVVAAG